MNAFAGMRNCYIAGQASHKAFGNMASLQKVAAIQLTEDLVQNCCRLLLGPFAENLAVGAIPRQRFSGYLQTLTEETKSLQTHNCPAAVKQPIYRTAMKWAAQAVQRRQGLPKMRCHELCSLAVDEV